MGTEIEERERKEREEVVVVIIQKEDRREPRGRERVCATRKPRQADKDYGKSAKRKVKMTTAQQER